jgi:UDPglucose--hexose-1-phosphate uridylyltransferase
MDINTVISALLNYAESEKLISGLDRAYSANRLLELLKLDTFTDNKTVSLPLCDTLSLICSYAYEKGIIESLATDYTDLFDTKVMGLVCPRPSEVIGKFYSLYENDPGKATDYFYDLSVKSNYIRADRIAKDLKWSVPSEYGDIDITVNLSKPEKDPRAIAAAKLLPQSGYPKCALCHENEGFEGSLSKAARQTLRQIPFDMAGTDWYLQYSPYVYYNEHCIALSSLHTPMKIDRTSFSKLLSFVTTFPHYFIGSNADLPIVGGSILSHDHMQGGRYTFAMERAKIDTPLVFSGYEDISAGIVKWPMSVIRLLGKDKERIVELADKILVAWRSYTDEEAFVYAMTDGEPHNTITPIARRRGEDYELDLVLRNNITTEENPLGVYHPHAEHHNIKKENIGLIEVMGLAVLPSRLKAEIAVMKDAILSGKAFASVPEIEKHAEWYAAFKDGYEFNEENTEDILKSEIGKTFVRVLQDAGVFKDTAEGRKYFARFVEYVNNN